MTPRTAIAGAAGIVGLLTIGGALAGPLAGIAGATDVNVGVLSTCDAAGKWQLQFQVQSLYDQPLEVVLRDSHSPVDLTVPPNGTRQVHETPGADTFVYQWTAPVAHLHGDGVSAPVTLHRPGGCSPAPTTTVPGPTSTTTCAAADPPRVDCGTTTVPPTTVLATVPPTTVAPPASSEVTTIPSSSASTVPPGTPNRVARSTIAPAPPTELPTTGDQATLLALIGGIIFGGGTVLVIVAMKRHPKQ